MSGGVAGRRRPAVRRHGAAALSVLRRYASPSLANHAVRSCAWAFSLARTDGLEVDVELLQVASLLHDLGLEEPFDSHTVAFEISGGAVAGVFAAGAGWDEHRQRRVGEVIERHMWRSVDPALDVEGHLLERATTIDVRGTGLDLIAPDVQESVLAEYPVLDFAERFVGCFRAQHDRKPGTAAARSVDAGIADVVAANPLVSGRPPVTDVEVAPVRASDADVLELVAALTAELAEGDYTPEQTFGYTPEQLASSPVQLVGARVDGVLVGIAGLEPAADGTAELKRFYVRPHHRGRGIADALLQDLLAVAADRGVGIVRLETGDRQHAALRFYARHGFTRIERFGPYVDSETSICLQRPLGAR